MVGDEIYSNQPPRLPVVGIGASAGGVKALAEFLDVLPRDTGAAFAVIMHLDPQTRSELPAILANHTDMPVVGVTGKVPLRPNHIYVISPDRQLQITEQDISA